MKILRSAMQRISPNLLYSLTNLFGWRTESQDGAAHWAAKTDFDAYFNSVDGHVRSLDLSEQIDRLGNINSLLEVGTNSGRNLAVIKRCKPSIELKGIDVNASAIAYARERSPEIVFEVADANHWQESPKRWDAILTMSVIDHIPDEAIPQLAANMIRTAKKDPICYELWDGNDGRRGLFKYSRNLPKLFEPF